MNTIDIKPLVEAAVHRAWDDFAADHPQLAKVLSEELLVESTLAELDKDPEYQSSITNAAAAGVMAETLGDLVGKLLRQVLNKLA